MNKSKVILSALLTSLLLVSCGQKSDEEVGEVIKPSNDIEDEFFGSEDDFDSFFDDVLPEDNNGSNSSNESNNNPSFGGFEDPMNNNQDNVQENNQNNNPSSKPNLGPEYDEIPPLPGEEPENYPPVIEEDNIVPEPDFSFPEEITPEPKPESKPEPKPESKPEQIPVPMPEVKPDTVNPVPPTEEKVTYNNSIELYRASVEALNNINYSYEGIGFSKPTAINTLNLHEKYSKQDGNISFSKASSGKPIAFNSTTYAEKFDIKGNEVTRASANSYKAYGVKDGRINVNNWSKNRNSSLDEIQNDFAKKGDEYIYYAIDLDTVTEDSLQFTVDENGNYKMNFVFVFDSNGDANSKTVNGYGKHITTVSHQEFKRVTSSEISLTLDENLKPISYDLHEKYEVIKLGLTCYIENTINYKFTY